MVVDSSWTIIRLAAHLDIICCRRGEGEGSGGRSGEGDAERSSGQLRGECTLGQGSTEGGQGARSKAIAGVRNADAASVADHTTV